MRPDIGEDYTGPLGKTYRVEDIDGEPSGLQWVVIRSGSEGAIRFPLFDCAKWLAPLPAKKPRPRKRTGQGRRTMA